MALWLFGCTAFQFHPRTRWGVQCPTAKVQTVERAVRDCCGKIVGLKIVVPGPGDRAFVQCRCAEKKTAQQEASLPPRLELFATVVHKLELPSPLVEPFVAHPYRVKHYTVSVPPLVRPPGLV
jgi:hypothetical protein